MVTIIIPGYSLHNKEWLKDTADQIDMEGEIRPIYWSHWDEPEKEFDPKDKARMIDDVVGPKMVNIVAKSIGTLAASYMVEKSPEKIRKIIFCGIPLNDLSEDRKVIIRAALKKIPPDLIQVYQNIEDPHASFDQAKIFFNEIDPEIEVISKDRNDHEYFYIDEFHDFLLK